jgi:hypothetical protein
MSAGLYISGAGHAALIVWLLAGWGLESRPFDMQMTEVSVISEDDFEDMMRAGEPDAPNEEVVAPTQPEIETQEPLAPDEDTAPQVSEPPAPVETPDPEAPPAPPEMNTPDAEVTDTVPDLPPISETPAPPPSTELGESARPVPRPSERIAPDPVAPPDPDTQVDDQVAEATSDTATEDETVEEEVDQSTAPEEAAPEIVTEAETPSGAPEVSLRPQARPSRPAPQTAETEEAESEPEESETADPVAEALAETASDPDPQPSAGIAGGQLSESTKTGFLRQIGRCWNVGSASTGAMRTKVTVAFSMTENGRVNTSSIELLGFEGGSQADADVAYRMARSALLRCQNETDGAGYDLPADKYEQWRNVELTFNPENMTSW